MLMNQINTLMTDGQSLVAPDKSSCGVLEGDMVPLPAMRIMTSSVEILHAEHLKVIIVNLDHLSKKRKEERMMVFLQLELACFGKTSC